MDQLFTPENLIALATLTSLEIVLGIDNIVFIAILTGRLPEAHRARVRFIGLSLAMIMRILLLLAISWIMGLTKPLFTFPVESWSESVRQMTGKDLVLILGGAFLIFKATREIHHKLEGPDEIPGDTTAAKKAGASVASTLVQIMLIDLVFSLDSVITAVGMAQAKWVMVTAVVISVIIMMVFAGAIARFIEKHPSMKVLALSFLLMIGALLLADGFGHHIPHGYVYFAMAFSLAVELVNLRAGTRKKPKTAAH